MNDNIFIEQLIAALLPAAVLLMLVVMRDKHREPASQLIKAILLGVAIVIPVIATEFAAQFAGTILGLGTDSLMGALYTSFIGAALPEEAFKLLALWFLLRKNRAFWGCAIRLHCFVLVAKALERKLLDNRNRHKTTLCAPTIPVAKIKICYNI